MGGVRPEWLAAASGWVRWIGITFVEATCPRTARGADAGATSRTDAAAAPRGDTHSSHEL